MLLTLGSKGQPEKLVAPAWGMSAPRFSVCRLAELEPGGTSGFPYSPRYHSACPCANRSGQRGKLPLARRGSHCNEGPCNSANLPTSGGNWRRDLGVGIGQMIPQGRIPAQEPLQVEAGHPHLQDPAPLLRMGFRQHLGMVEEPGPPPAIGRPQAHQAAQPVRPEVLGDGLREEIHARAPTKTVPGGQPAPMRMRTRCRPLGVQPLSRLSPGPLRAVETGASSNKTPSSNRRRRWLAKSTRIHLRATRLSNIVGEFWADLRPRATRRFGTHAPSAAGRDNSRTPPRSMEILAVAARSQRPTA